MFLDLVVKKDGKLADVGCQENEGIPIETIYTHPVLLLVWMHPTTYTFEHLHMYHPHTFVCVWNYRFTEKSERRFKQFTK